MPTLYIFSGLPGSGKSTLAQELARRVAAVYLRIDTMEQTLKEVAGIEVKTEGYAIAYRVAAENLRLGLNVVADSCNSIVITRKEWERVAVESGAPHVNIEIVCSDKAEHRRRVETRAPLPTWQEVESREYHTWSGDRIIIETSGKSEGESLGDLYRALALTK